jgi:hypothetical protein
MTELWTAQQAGEHCGTVGATYRYYVKRLGAPAAVDRDVETGAKLYDATAVQAWHANRAGRGYRTDLRERS